MKRMSLTKMLVASAVWIVCAPAILAAAVMFWTPPPPLELKEGERPLVSEYAVKLPVPVIPLMFGPPLLALAIWAWKRRRAG